MYWEPVADWSEIELGKKKREVRWRSGGDVMRRISIKREKENKERNTLVSEFS